MLSKFFCLQKQYAVLYRNALDSIQGNLGCLPHVHRNKTNMRSSYSLFLWSTSVFPDWILSVEYCITGAFGLFSSPDFFSICIILKYLGSTFQVWNTVVHAEMTANVSTP